MVKKTRVKKIKAKDYKSLLDKCKEVCRISFWRGFRTAKINIVEYTDSYSGMGDPGRHLWNPRP